jgi:hypothetical protein
VTSYIWHCLTCNQTRTIEVKEDSDCECYDDHERVSPGCEEEWPLIFNCDDVARDYGMISSEDQNECE